MVGLTTVAAYQKELEAMIVIEVERVLEKMANGFVESFEEYKSLSGKIAGLRSAIDLMREADRVMAEKYR